MITISGCGSCYCCGLGVELEQCGAVPVEVEQLGAPVGLGFPFATFLASKT